MTLPCHSLGVNFNSYAIMTRCYPLALAVFEVACSEEVIGKAEEVSFTYLLWRSPRMGDGKKIDKQCLFLATHFRNLYKVRTLSSVSSPIYSLMVGI